MNQRIRVLIVDDHSLFRETLARVLAAEEDMVVVAHNSNIDDAIRTLSSHPVEVVILDYDLGASRGSALINWAAAGAFHGRFLIVTAGLAEADALRLIEQDVGGIFLKENHFSELLAAVRAVARGDQWLDPPFVKLAMNAPAPNDAAPSSPPPFSQREQTVLRYIAEGCSNREIASRLQTSEVAVKATLQRLFDKVGVRTRGHLIRIALQKYQDFL